MGNRRDGSPTTRPRPTLAYAELAGRTVRQAQTRIVELLGESGALIGEPRPITHPVKFYEKGDRPLEIVSSRQWFVLTLPLAGPAAGPGRGAALAPALHGPPLPGLGRGSQRRLEHQPPALLRRPLPGLVPGGRRRRDRLRPPIFAAEDRLPVDPSTDVPEGYAEDQRGRPGGFVGDPDVMDTWATSSLTPQIAGGWEDDPDLFARVFPMDVRPQAHEIIRTWLFSTVVRSELEHGSLPWTDAAISGWVLDPDRKKMSKSKGNVVTPLPLLEKHGADAVRYWAAGGRPGTDTAFDEGQMKVGRRLAIKVLERLAVRPRPDGRRRRHGGRARHRLGHRAASTGPCWAGWPRSSTRPPRPSRPTTTPGPSSAPRRSSGPSATTTWSWSRPAPTATPAEPGPASARAALALALSVLLRLLAPVLPFVTEEVWSWWQAGSIHTAPWPDAGEFDSALPDGARDLGPVLEVAAEVLGQVRRAKTTRQALHALAGGHLTVADTAERIAALLSAEDDLATPAGWLDLVTAEADEPRGRSSWPRRSDRRATGPPPGGQVGSGQVHAEGGVGHLARGSPPARCGRAP